jgi:quinohemoprotein ethanol dehydrogenase
MSDWWDRPGVLATAGGLVFQGTGTGYFCAYDAETGKKMKEIEIGTSVIAAPMSYTVDGVQYVAVMAGWGGGGWNFPHPQSAAYQRGNEGRIIAFKLGGGPAPIPALLPPIKPIPQPPPLTASAEMVKQGATLFAAHCSSCHANAPHTLTPDLRRMSLETHDAFQKIVLGGLLENAGMPPWNGVLSPADVDAIHAYLISISWDAYKKQQAAPNN